MSQDPASFEEFKRQRELERLKRKARGEESGEQPLAPPARTVTRRTHRRRASREPDTGSTFGL
jgi:hypothetical protein